MVVGGVWPLLHLQMAEELISFHGNVLFILINAWQTQGLLPVGFVAHPRSPKCDIPGVLAHTSSKSRFCPVLREWKIRFCTYTNKTCGFHLACVRTQGFPPTAQGCGMCSWIPAHCYHFDNIQQELIHNTKTKPLKTVYLQFIFTDYPSEGWQLLSDFHPL